MIHFEMYLEEAQQAVERKYDTHVTLFLGEYIPEVDHLLFHYYFSDGQVGYKVIVNTWAGGPDKLLIRKIPLHKNNIIEPIDQPVLLSLSDAYEIAVAEGYMPNLYLAVVFMENKSELQLGPGYWFMNEQNDREWIFVSLDERRATVTRLSPSPF